MAFEVDSEVIENYFYYFVREKINFHNLYVCNFFFRFQAFIL